MRFVTLTSDWHKEDFYSGALQGSILGACKDTEFVTISNKVRAHSVSEASFIVRNSYHHFPKGTIHIVAVGTQPEPANRMLVAYIDGHYFLTADNGTLGLLGEKEKGKVISIKRELDESTFSFPSLFILATAAIKLINGSKFEDLGDEVTDYKEQIPLRATLENDIITGTVIYIDTYGNAITNISKDIFDRIGKNKRFVIFVQSKHYKITKINKYYSETTAGDLLAIFNSINLLEIAIRNGDASSLLNLNTDSTIRVEFRED